MRASKRTQILTGNVATRLTPEEAKQVAEAARRAGLSTSEWVRRAIINGLETGADTRLLLSELLALRKILLLLYMDSYEGEKASEARLKRAVELAESTKFAMSEKRILALQSHMQAAEKKTTESAA
jgi:hypothetical protein